MIYDLIHFAVFVLIELCVMLCEHLIKKWRSSLLAVALLGDTPSPSIKGL